jgi:thioredoxin 1
MMLRRALFFPIAAIALAATALSASAFELKPYEEAAAKKAIASGKPVVLHVYAPWCLQCRAQSSILSDLSSRSKDYDGIAFFRVAYGDQADVVQALGVPRSTLIAYRNGKETGRMSWGMTEQSVVDVLKSAM